MGQEGVSAESSELIEDNDNSLTQSQELNVFGGGISLQILPPENVRWLLND